MTNVIVGNCKLLQSNNIKINKAAFDSDRVFITAAQYVLFI